MLFAKVSKEGSEAIKDVLDLFCEELGKRLAMRNLAFIYFWMFQPLLKKKFVKT